jgi:hypothetical protein
MPPSSLALLALAVLACACAGSRRQHADDHANRTNERLTILQMIGGDCTEEGCGPPSPCCHTCGSSGVWTEVREPHRVARTKSDRLPDCAADGCGRCSFTVAAVGVTDGDQFVVTRWTQLPGCVAQLCQGAGACDAVLADGYWIWTGERCQAFYDSGCSLAGPDCEGIYPNRNACEKARAACRPAR